MKPDGTTRRRRYHRRKFLRFIRPGRTTERRSGSQGWDDESIHWCGIARSVVDVEPLDAANGIDRLINNRNLYHTWLWQAPFLRIWVIILPAVAFVFMAASYSDSVELRIHRSIPQIECVIMP